MRCPSCLRRNPDNYLYCAHCGAALGTASGERRFATVVFFDLSDYTRFTREHGPEVAWQEAERAFSVVQSAIEREGGEIHKVFGDGLIAVFGLGKSRGAEAEGALRAAAAAVHEVETRFQKGILKLRGRAAVTSGLVLAMPTLSGRELFGDPMNRAQRLVAFTPPGSVHLDDTTHTLAKNAMTTPLPPLTAKGFPEPLKAFRLEGFITHAENPFEDALMGELEAAWNEVRRGRGQVAVLVGPPGVGKRLAIQAFLKKHDRIPVLRLPPLKPETSVRGWIRGFLESAPNLKERVLELDLSPDLRKKMEIALGFRPGKVCEAEGIAAVAEAIRKLATEPWILLLEGLHRAPPILLRFLEEWHGAEGKLLILGTARSGSFPITLKLSRLPLEEAVRWLAVRFPRSDPEARRKAAELADGLPGLMVQLLPWPEEERLLAAMQPHFDAVGEAREALFLASVLGEPIPEERLEAVLGLRAKVAVHHLLEEGFFKSTPRGLVFQSRAYQRAAAISVPRAKKRAWLRALGDAYLAAGKTEEAVRYYIEAGLRGAAIRVLRVLARDLPEEKALPLLEQARALATSREQAAPVLLDLAERVLEKDPARALRLLEDVAGPRALKLRGQALAALGEFHESSIILDQYLKEHPDDLETWHRFLRIAPAAVLREVTPPDDPELLCVLARRLEGYQALAEAARAYERALRRIQGDRAAGIAIALAGLAWRSYRPRDARRHAEKALREAQTPATITLAGAILGSLELDVGRLETAEVRIQDALRGLDRMACSAAYARVAGIELRLLIETGRLDQAAARAAHHLRRCDHPWIGAMATLIAALKGDAETALAWARTLLPRADSHHTAGYLRLAIGVAHAVKREDPRPAYRLALRLSAKAQNPYLRFLALAAFALYYRPDDPEKTKAIADQMLRLTWRRGFLPFHHLARLLKAEAARAAGRQVRPLLRFESPFPALEYWRRSLLRAEGMEVEPIPEARVLGYGILGRLALASWKRVWIHAKRSARESA